MEVTISTKLTESQALRLRQIADRIGASPDEAMGKVMTWNVSDADVDRWMTEYEEFLDCRDALGRD